jgi:hypothetical protein
MPFVNEVVSDADIDAYGLGFRKGDGRWWTRDKERDFYLWGGLDDLPSFGEYEEGRFYMLVDGVKLEILLSPGEWSKNWHVKPYVVSWSKVQSISPKDCGELDRDRLISILKEALNVYGYDGEDNHNVPDRVVKFGF